MSLVLDLLNFFDAIACAAMSFNTWQHNSSYSRSIKCLISNSRKSGANLAEIVSEIDDSEEGVVFALHACILKQ